MSKNKYKQSFEGKDSFSRMNFLFQASMLMAKRNPVLSAYYGNLCKNIGKKTVLRIDPQLKRNLCKKCSLALRPGITADISIEIESTPPKNSPNLKDKADGLHMKVECRKCNHNRSFKVVSNYNFWLEKPESIAKILTTVEFEDKNLIKQRNTLMNSNVKSKN